MDEPVERLERAVLTHAMNDGGGGTQLVGHAMPRHRGLPTGSSYAAAQEIVVPDWVHIESAASPQTYESERGEGRLPKACARRTKPLLA